MVNHRISRSLRPGLNRIQGLKSSWYQGPILRLCIQRAPLDRILVGIRALGHPRLGTDRRVAGRTDLGRAVRVQRFSVRRRLVHFRAHPVHVLQGKCIARCSSFRGPALRQCRKHLPPMLIDKGLGCRCVDLLSVVKRALMNEAAVDVGITIHHSPILQLRRLYRSCPPVLTLQR